MKTVTKTARKILVHDCSIVASPIRNRNSKFKNEKTPFFKAIQSLSKKDFPVGPSQSNPVKPSQTKSNRPSPPHKASDHIRAYPTNFFILPPFGFQKPAKNP
jgi:hypothetical protein